MPSVSEGYKFNVSVIVDNLRPWEKVYVLGSAPELGEWNHQLAHELKQNAEGKSEGSIILVGRQKSVDYRYFIGSLLDPAQEDGQPIRIIVKYEAQLRPRRILFFNGIANTNDTFGSYDGRTTISDGWLTNPDEKTFFVRIHGKALEIFPGKGKQKTYRIKMVPFDVRFEEASSIDENDVAELPMPKPGYPSFSETELSVLTRTDPYFGAQYENGSVFRNNIDYLVFRTRTVALDHLAFCIEFYEEHGKNRVGVAWALPAGLSETFGKAKYAIINKHQQPMGQIIVDYMKVNCWIGNPTGRDNLSVSYSHHWKKRTTVEVGHRGMGASYSKMATARENTVHSLNIAAKKGADFVEFDVQLTKDFIPVIYHDFHVLVQVSQRKNESKDDLSFLNHHELAVKELKMRQLKLLHLEHTSYRLVPADNLGVTPKQGEECEVDHEPFPSLADVLKRVDKSVGFNVEIKYPMLQQDGLHECENYFERNIFIDRILDEIYEHAGNRRIVFSSFDPDMCTQISLKQHKFPVLFLVIGATTRYVPFEDMRSDCSKLAVHYTAGSRLLGINFHSEELLKDREPFDLARNLNLTTFVWGDDTNEKTAQEFFKNTLNIDGMIYDRIGEDEERKNIFVVEKEAKAALFERSVHGSPNISRRGSAEDAPHKGDPANGTTIPDIHAHPKGAKRVHSLLIEDHS